MAMDPPPHVVVISSNALVKRGCEHRDPRLPARSRLLPRNDHFGALAIRSAGARAGSCNPSQPPERPGSVPTRQASARTPSPVVRTPHTSTVRGPRRRAGARPWPRDAAALPGSSDPGQAGSAAHPRTRSRSDPKNPLQNCQQITQTRATAFPRSTRRPRHLRRPAAPAISAVPPPRHLRRPAAPAAPAISATPVHRCCALSRASP
jgi:hypothetical protein